MDAEKDLMEAEAHLRMLSAAMTQGFKHGLAEIDKALVVANGGSVIHRGLNAVCTDFMPWD
ncbi:hypothetical protein C6503_03520 [Candidatus Poribacteria bacterium]|nr:MAG: hypothetical protein C6503_03520 [Candidatus Poribacteria bacterium]